MIKTEILVPLLNANEPEARLTGVHIKDRQRVEKGALLFTLETTKAAMDIESPEGGFIHLLASEGDILAVGETLAVVTESAGEEVDFNKRVHAEVSPGQGLRITRPAREMAERLGIDLSKLPAEQLITESVVQKFAMLSAKPKPAKYKFTDSSILVYGGGGHAKTVVELVRATGIFDIAGIVDDKIPVGSEVLGVPVLGTRDILSLLASSGLKLAANGVGGIIDISVRVKLFELLEGLCFTFPALVHPHTTIEPSAQVAEGVQVFAGAYVGSSAVLCLRCMVNTGAIVSHDCKIGAYTHVAPGAMLAGHVQVGERTLIGMGVTTAIGVQIGSGVRIGNNATIYGDVPDKTILPAGKVWPERV